MRKTNRTSNRPSSSPLHLLEFGPDGDWYSRYWLEDKPWPDLAFCVGRSLRRGARIVTPILRTSGRKVFDRLSRAFSGFKWLKTRGAER
jgi:hypothetical protein